MKKLFDLYSNKYFKLIVLLGFVTFLFFGHPVFENARKEAGVSHDKETFKKVVEYVDEDTKGGLGSYKAVEKYERIETKKSAEDSVSAIDKLKHKIQAKLGQKSFERKEQEERADKVRMKRKEIEERIQKIADEFEIKEGVLDGESVECGDMVNYKYALFSGSKPAGMQPLKLSILVGLGANSKLEKEFIGKKVGEVFEADMNVFSNIDSPEVKKQIKQIQDEVIKENIEGDEEGILKALEYSKSESYFNTENKYKIKIEKIVKTKNKIKCKIKKS